MLFDGQHRENRIDSLTDCFRADVHLIPFRLSLACQPAAVRSSCDRLPPPANDVQCGPGRATELGAAMRLHTVRRPDGPWRSLLFSGLCATAFPPRRPAGIAPASQRTTSLEPRIAQSAATRRATRATTRKPRDPSHVEASALRVCCLSLACTAFPEQSAHLFTCGLRSANVLVNALISEGERY